MGKVLHTCLWDMNLEHDVLTVWMIRDKLTSRRLYIRILFNKASHECERF